MTPRQSQQNSHSVESVQERKFIPNDTVPFPVQSEWFRVTTRSVRMIRKPIPHSHGIIFTPNESETCIRDSTYFCRLSDKIFTHKKLYVIIIFKS